MFPNSKKYVGISGRDLERRWNHGNGYSTQPRVFRAIKKYGWNSVTHIVLLTGLTPWEAMYLERRLIADGNTTDPRFGYNDTIGGETPGIWGEASRQKLREQRLGKKASPETRAKLSAMRRGRKASDSHRANISAGQRGRVHSEETRAKIRAKALGRTVSQETRAKLSIASSLKTNSPETRAKISKSNRGRVWTEAHKEHLRAALANKSPHTAESKAKIAAGIAAYRNNPDNLEVINSRIARRSRAVWRLSPGGERLERFISVGAAAKSIGVPRKSGSKIGLAANARAAGKPWNAYGVRWEWDN